MIITGGHGDHVFVVRIGLNHILVFGCPSNIRKHVAIDAGFFVFQGFAVFVHALAHDIFQHFPAPLQKQKYLPNHARVFFDRHVALAGTKAAFDVEIHAGFLWSSRRQDLADFPDGKYLVNQSQRISGGAHIRERTKVAVAIVFDLACDKYLRERLGRGNTYVRIAFVVLEPHIEPRL